VPYMSIDLMQPSKPLEHRLEHDLESMLLVILHIVRFTCGPTANPSAEVKQDFNIAIWHYEHTPHLIKGYKRLDIHNMCIEPERFITNYWNPIASQITMLINLIYPGGLHKKQHEMLTGPATCKSFKEILVAARDVCEGLQEQTPNYAGFITKKRKSRAPDREKTKQSRLMPQRDAVHRPIRPSPGPGS
jgi:hypothetical protein